jgi:hypothetical protein
MEIHGAFLGFDRSLEAWGLTLTPNGVVAVRLTTSLRPAREPSRDM